MKAPRYIADFDSTSAMARALGRYLQGKDFPGLGVLPTAPPLVWLLDAVTGSERVRKLIYSWGGWKEAISPDELAGVEAEEFSRWVAQLYPERIYPAIMIGSSNGAAAHLCAALGIPWLPQTFLILVRHPGLHPDEPGQDLEWGVKPGQALLNNNPDLQLHHARRQPGPFDDSVYVLFPGEAPSAWRDFPEVYPGAISPWRHSPHPGV